MVSAGSESSSLQSSANGRTAELSLYDRSRQPHVAITDNTEVVISPRSLNSELCCPICLDLLKNTMTTKECLHRFCQECITTALLRGNKECPTCRKKLVSKRSLRPDPNFDALIDKIYPDREEYDAMQERALQRFNRQNSTEALQRSIEEGIKAQSELRRQRVAGSYHYEKRKRRPKAIIPAEQPPEQQPPVESGPTSDRESSLEPSASEASGAAFPPTHQQEIELILKPQLETEGNSTLEAHIRQTRYLKTTADATIDHLCKYLSMRIQLDAEEANRVDASPDNMQRAPPLTNPDEKYTFQVLIAAQLQGVPHGRLVSLEGNLTLQSVRNLYWKLKKPLELNFIIKERVTGEVTSVVNSNNTN